MRRQTVANGRWLCNRRADRYGCRSKSLMGAEGSVRVKFAPPASQRRRRYEISRPARTCTDYSHYHIIWDRLCHRRILYRTPLRALCRSAKRFRLYPFRSSARLCRTPLCPVVFSSRLSCRASSISRTTCRDSPRVEDDRLDRCQGVGDDERCRMGRAVTSRVADAAGFQPCGAAFVWGARAEMTLLALVYVGKFGSRLPYENDWDVILVLTGSEPLALAYLWAKLRPSRAFGSAGASPSQKVWNSPGRLMYQNGHSSGIRGGRRADVRMRVSAGGEGRGAGSEDGPAPVQQAVDVTRRRGDYNPVIPTCGWAHCRPERSPTYAREGPGATDRIARITRPTPAVPSNPVPAGWRRACRGTNRAGSP